MNRQNVSKLSNTLFDTSTIAKLVAVFSLIGLLSLYFQNVGALIAMLVLMIGVCVGNLYERRH